ncbi:MAG: hypothetical protein JKY92_00585, partial [Magnetovibrio sp.]|nr:hypothetical protein [Magnetovibrio sp.]
MVLKTALISLISTLLVGVFALSYDGGGSSWKNGRGGVAGMTGASGSWAQSGGRGDWGGGASSFTGASG